MLHDMSYNHDGVPYSYCWWHIIVKAMICVAVWESCEFDSQYWCPRSYWAYHYRRGFCTRSYWSSEYAEYWICIILPGKSQDGIFQINAAISSKVMTNARCHFGPDWWHQWSQLSKEVYWCHSSMMLLVIMLKSKVSVFMEVLPDVWDLWDSRVFCEVHDQ